jgi:hypothetical protein
MENNTSNTSNALTDLLNDSFQKLANASMDTMKPLMESMLSSYADMSKSMLEKGTPTLKLPKLSFQSDDCGCCPPKTKCAPHCMSTISRKAMEGESIIVPFLIKNTCSVAKTYKIGVRELKNVDGTLAPTQPILDKASVTLDPGRSELVRMGIKIHGYTNGATYNTEIVLREKEINQNICFTLVVDSGQAPVISPLDEQKYKLKWQSWDSHYYCEPERKIIRQVDTNTTVDIKQ